MLNDFFINNLWASIGLWLILSISDSLLTVTGARLYQGGVKEHFLSSGSYELEPGRLSLRLSSVDFFGFGLLLLVVYLFASNLVILGGAAACFLIAVRHWLLSINKHSKEEVLDSSRA